MSSSGLSMAKVTHLLKAIKLNEPIIHYRSFQAFNTSNFQADFHFFALMASYFIFLIKKQSTF